MLCANMRQARPTATMPCCISASFHQRVRLVLLASQGPTTKADCLNRLYRALCADEAVLGGFRDDSDSMPHHRYKLSDCLRPSSCRASTVLPSKSAFEPTWLP